MLPFDSGLMTPSCAGPEFVQTFWEERALKPELFAGWLWTPLGKEQVLLDPNPRLHYGFRESREVTPTSEASRYKICPYIQAVIFETGLSFKSLRLHHIRGTCVSCLAPQFLKLTSLRLRNCS